MADEDKLVLSPLDDGRHTIYFAVRLFGASHYNNTNNKENKT